MHFHAPTHRHERVFVYIHPRDHARVLVHRHVSRGVRGVQTGDTEGGSCPDREMRIVSVYELSGVGEQIAQSN